MKRFIIFAAIVLFVFAAIHLTLYFCTLPPTQIIECYDLGFAEPDELYGDINFDSVSDLLESFTTELDETIDKRQALLSVSLSADRIEALRYSNDILTINDKYGYLITKFGYGSVNQAIEETGFDKTDLWLSHLKKAKEFETAIDDLLAPELGYGFDKATNTMDNNNVISTVTSAYFLPNGFVEVNIVVTNKSEYESKTIDRLACDGISFWLYDNDGNRLYDIYPFFATWKDTNGTPNYSTLVPPLTTAHGTIIYDTRNYSTAKVFFVPTGGGILEGSEITVNQKI